MAYNSGPSCKNMKPVLTLSENQALFAGAAPVPLVHFVSAVHSCSSGIVHQATPQGRAGQWFSSALAAAPNHVPLNLPPALRIVQNS
jgi:hypothetical protein